MLSSVSLIIVALSLGGLLIKFGIIKTLIESMTGLIGTPGRLILATLVGSVGVNFFWLGNNTCRSFYPEKLSRVPMMPRGLIENIYHERWPPGVRILIRWFRGALVVCFARRLWA